MKRTEVKKFDIILYGRNETESSRRRKDSKGFPLRPKDKMLYRFILWLAAGAKLRFFRMAREGSPHVEKLIIPLQKLRSPKGDGSTNNYRLSF